MKTLEFYRKEYRIFVVFDKVKHIFFVKALHNKTKRYSFITNLNCILPQFNVDIDNPIFWDSSWELSKKNIDSFIKESINFLNDKNFLNFLEKQLNEDRNCGEWENIKY